MRGQAGNSRCAAQGGRLKTVTWPCGGGEMGERIRTFDWSATTLGPIDTWPPTLRAAVELMLGARQPAYIAWGPDHTSLHNDAYIPILGAKHPALGQPYAELWKEIWDEYRPYVEATMAGEAQYWVDQPVALAGRPGRPVSWFTFSWTPLRDERGKVGGFYCAATETTEKILAERALVQSMDEGFCVLELIFDAAGRPVDFQYMQANPSFEKQSGLVNAIGKTIRQMVPDIEGHWIDTYGRVAVTGEPIRFVEEAVSMGRWFDVYAFRTGDASSRQIGVLFRDITGQKRAEEEFRSSQLRAENALAIAQLGTFEWNMRTGMVKCSERTREIFGFREGEGDTAGEYFARIAGADVDRIRQEIQASLAMDGKLHTEYRIVLPDGTVRHVVSMSACEKDAHGTWERQVGVFSDITERTRVEQELREAGRRKDEFLAMLAHELRNPLAPISAAAELLRLGRADEAWIKQASAIITRQVSHMTGLVDDLLDVSRVTRGLVTIERKRLDARHIVFDAVEQIGPLIEARGHRLSVQTASEPAFVLGDQKRLVQVLTNLLSNAVKYTPEGGEIELAVEPRDGHVRVSVSDNGIGMTQELVDRAFDLFAQAERTSDRSQGGLGIGLALVKSLVSLHGGTVAAHSDGMGKGSRFTICLPHAKEAAEEGQGRHRAGIATAVDKPLKILVVDDNADAAQTLSMLVRAMGHLVAVEHSSHSTLERVRQDPPDVCLLDIGLPDMDGNVLARCIRSMPEMAHAVLVAVTGYGQETDRRRALDAGFDHHFVKPVDSRRLADILADAGGR